MPPRPTPMLPFHRKEDAKFTTVGEVRVPLFFESVDADYTFTRRNCGLVDFGFFDLVRINGTGARKFLDAYCTTDLAGPPAGSLQRTLLTDDGGSIVDIPFVFPFEDFLLLLVTPGRVDAVIDLMADAVPEELEIESFNDAYTPIALIGPESENVVRATMRNEYPDIDPGDAVVCNLYTAKLILAQMELFGESCFLLLAGRAHLDTVIERLFESAGEKLKPAGVSTVDILRIEAGEPLPGYEAVRGVLPMELGLMEKVDFDKKAFSGREAIFEAAQHGRSYWLVTFVMKDDIIPRRNMQIFANDMVVGHVTSGTYSPQLGKGIGLGLADRAYAIKGTRIEIARRNRRFAGEIVSRSAIAAAGEAASSAEGEG